MRIQGKTTQRTARAKAAFRSQRSCLLTQASEGRPEKADGVMQRLKQKLS